MAEDNLQALVAELSLNTRRIERQQRRLITSFDSTMGKIEKGGSKRLTAVERRAEQMSRNVRRALVAIGVGVAGREVLEYEAAWRATTNTLKQYTDVLGPAQQAGSKLNQIANDARAPLSELSGLTGAAARSARDLGRSGADVYLFGEAAAKGARLANTGGAAVEGAFIQLSQAIASPRVQLQEFNSIIEGTPRLAQAFADGVGGAGGSVARLRRMIADGEVSGGMLFDALISQVETLREEFETLDQGPAEALTRLQNRLTEFLGTNNTVKAGASALTSAIDFLADNLDGLADSIVIGTAALSGYFGAQGLVAVATGLKTVAVGATASAKAMAVLRAAMTFLGGPGVLAIAAVAGGVAALLIHAKKSAEAFEDIRESAITAGAALREYNKAADPEAVKQQAVDLSKVKEEYYGIAAAIAVAAEAEKARQVNALLAERQERAAALEVLERRLNTRAMKRAGNVDKRNQLAADVEHARALLEQYDARIQEVASQSIPSIADGLELPDKNGGSDSDDDDVKDARKAAKSALEELSRAVLATYDAERRAADDAYRERVKAIETLGLKGEEAAQQRLLAEIARSDELARIDAEEQKAKDEKIKREQDLVKREEDLLQEALDARDRAADRSIAIALREFERRREILENSFADTPEGNARKEEAMAALDEEETSFRDTARDASAGFETGSPMESRIQAIEDARDRELELELEKLELLTGYQEEYEARRLEIIAASEEQITEVRRTALAAQLGAASDTFDGLAGLAKAFAGKQTGVYRTLFATAKAFSLAETLLSAPSAAAKAIKNSPLPYPLNLAAGAATYAAVMAQVAEIGSIGPGFANGVIGFRGKGTGTSDDNNVRISNGESIIREVGTRKNPNLLRLVNAGVDVESQLARYAQPLAVNPAFFATGGRQIHIGGSKFEFNGPVDQAALPAMTALLDQRDRALARMMEELIAQDHTATTPRHERKRFFGG